MIRLRAALIHLGISTNAVGVLFLLFWLVWYPSPLFQAMNAGHIFLLILMIDLVLGPLLTLIVFNPAKKSLKMDLAAIALIQIGALLYGAHTLYSARPVYIAAIGNRFDVIQAMNVDAENLNASGQHLPWLGPKWVGTRIPDDPVEREKVVSESEYKGGEPGRFPLYHTPLETMRDQVLRQAKPITALRALHPDKEAAINRWLSEHGVSNDQTVVFQGLITSTESKDMAVIFDAKTAEVIGIAPFKPW